jgi:beta-phosphoglucomutase-like phosphatase (HAD superfamily)
MAERDGRSERGRAHEEDYFRKKDRELIEKMREAASAQQARSALGAATGLSDPALLQDLQELGFTPDTVVLLPLVPIVQMAWAEGGVTGEERKMIVELARARGVAAGSTADRQLTGWLDRRPAPDVFTRATRLIGAMLANPSEARTDLTADELIKYCENIAAASGGIFGIGRVSAEERSMLARIAEELKGRG